MGGKQLINGQERFDGLPVTLHEGRFAGSFELEEDDALDMAYDDRIVFVVVAHVGKATINSTKMGDLKRQNTFDVSEVLPLGNNYADKVFEVINTPHLAGWNPQKEQLPLDEVSESAEVPDKVDALTGEILAEAEEILAEAEEEEDFDDEPFRPTSTFPGTFAPGTAASHDKQLAGFLGTG